MRRWRLRRREERWGPGLVGLRGDCNWNWDWDCDGDGLLRVDEREFCWDDEGGGGRSAWILVNEKDGCSELLVLPSRLDDSRSPRPSSPSSSSS